MDLKARAKQLKRDIPGIAVAMGKRETPILAKIVGVVIVSYALSPIDLIPDFIPVLGLVDDLILLPLLIVLMRKLIPADLLEACRKEGEALWADKKPQKWLYAIPVVIVWSVLLWLLLGVAT